MRLSVKRVCQTQVLRKEEQFIIRSFVRSWRFIKSAAPNLPSLRSKKSIMIFYRAADVICTRGRKKKETNQ